MNSHHLTQASKTAELAVSNVAESAHHLGSAVRNAGHDALDSLRSATHVVGEQFNLAGERSTRYVRDEPVKAVLIAAVAGATLAALAGWWVRSSRS